MSDLQLKLRKLSTESFRSNNDLNISNEGAILDYFRTFFHQ